jgi:hypothetical protein
MTWSGRPGATPRGMCDEADEGQMDTRQRGGNVPLGRPDRNE